MLFRNLDQNGDWTFGNGVGNYVVRNNAIGLNIKTRIQSWVNDCFFALTDGVDWYNRLGTKNQRVLLEQDLRRIILQSQDVTGIIEFDTILNDRDIQVFYSVQTIYTQAYQETVSVSI